MKPEKPMLIPEDREFDSPPGDLYSVQKRGFIEILLYYKEVQISMEISLHSNQKHEALSYYLRVLRDVIMSPHTPFRRLYYVDLYCGDGECEIKRTSEKYEPPLFASVLKPAKEGKFNVSCFLNDIEQEKINKISQKTKEYSEFIAGVYCDDANGECLKAILGQIPADQISFFFLDPTNHKDLKWETIKQITRHTCSYIDKSGNQKIRRPEMMINCMVYSMMNCYRAHDYKSITESLGTDEWLKIIHQHKQEESYVFKVFLEVFIEQLKKLGYCVPSPIPIKSTKAENDIYYLVWATNEPGYKIIVEKILPYLQKHVSKRQKQNKAKLKKVEAVEQARKCGDMDINRWLHSSNI